MFLNSYKYNCDKKTAYIKKTINPFNTLSITFSISIVMMFVILYFANIDIIIVWAGCLFVIVTFAFLVLNLIKSRSRYYENFELNISKEEIKFLIGENSFLIHKNEIDKISKNNHGEITIKTQKDSRTINYEFIDDIDSLIEDLNSIKEIEKIQQNAIIFVLLNYLLGNSTFFILVLILGKTGPAFIYLIACIGYVVTFLVEILTSLIKKEFKEILNIFVLVRGVYGILVLKVLLNYFLK
jgi:hypothetical protein